MYSSRMPPFESEPDGVLNPDGCGVGDGRPKPIGELPSELCRLLKLDPKPKPSDVGKALWVLLE